MKIIHLISGGDTGGAKTHMFSLLKGLKEFADVKLICFIEDKFYYEALDLGIDAQVLKQNNRADMSVVKDIADIVNRKGYDLVHCHGARANTVGFFLKKRIKVPMITTIHSDYELDFKDSFYKNLIFTTINKIALSRFDYYVAITKVFRDLLVSRGFDPEKIYVMYNGIDTEKKEMVSKEEFLKRYGINLKDELVVVQAARMDNVKNVSMSLDVAKELKDRNIKIKMLLAGTGAEYEKLKQKSRELDLEDMVYFLGYVEDVYSLFNVGDINLLTSLSESFPYAILEAAILGVPTIATKVGGIPEQIEDGVDGYLVEINDYKAMADKIEELVKSPDGLNEFSTKMKNKVENNFSSRAMAIRQMEIYEDIVERQSDDR